ncbi:hypothetical protein BU23DRAFT_386812, partial [Bimuria novae-zelandiae CBS 107.79]
STFITKLVLKAFKATSIAPIKANNSGLRDTLTTKKQRKNASKPLNLQREEEYYGGATFWSPSKFERAREREA